MESTIENLPDWALVPWQTAAGLTGVSRSRLYELMQAGEIEGVTLGTSRRFVVRSLREWAERQAAGRGAA